MSVVQEERRSSLDQPKPAVILSPKETRKRTTLSRSSIFRLEQDGRFPAKRKISDSRVGYLESEITEWVLNREVV